MNPTHFDNIPLEIQFQYSSSLPTSKYEIAFCNFCQSSIQVASNRVQLLIVWHASQSIWIYALNYVPQ